MASRPTSLSTTAGGQLGGPSAFHGSTGGALNQTSAASVSPAQGTASASNPQLSSSQAQQSGPVLTAEEIAAATKVEAARLEARAMDINMNTVRIPRISLRGVDLTNKLDFAHPAGTWHTWAEELQETLGKVGGKRFLTGEWLMPDPAWEPASHNNWTLGNEAVLSVMLSSLHPTDKDWIRSSFKGEPTAHLAYRALAMRYTQCGTAAQIRLLVSALERLFTAGTSHLTTLTKICRQ
ncbi:unnamed protein product [Peniophora sp. CBMAI 1063]|nr:unnamed protein product [Peniophora sp. CBMAI 1063]